MLEWLVFAVIGKLVIHLWMKFPIPQFISDNKQKRYIYQFIDELHRCDLCSGFWIYSLLAILLGVDILQEVFGYTVEIVGNILTGAVTSFVVHIFSIGWKNKYEVIVI
jgi:hypothetical protein